MWAVVRRHRRASRGLLIGAMLGGLIAYGILLARAFTLIASTSLSITPSSGLPTAQISADAKYITSVCSSVPPVTFTFNFTWDKTTPLTSVAVSTCNANLTYDTGIVALVPPAGAAAGPHEVEVTVFGPTGAPAPNGTAAQPYTIVAAATVTIKPTCGSPGDQITIDGTGFQPDLTIQLVFVPGAVALPPTNGGNNGSFQVMAPIPNLPPALYELDATQFARAGPRNAKASLQVPCFNPVLKLVPDVGAPGTVVTAIGTGFPLTAPIDFAWTVGILQPGVATVTTLGDGTFSFPILIFPHDTIGARQLVARPNLKSPIFASVSADFLVVPGSVQPHDFSWRH